MAFLLPNLSPSLLLHHKPKEKTSIQQSLSPQPKPHSHYLSPLSLTSPSASTSLQTPPLQGVAQVNTPPGAQDNHQKDDFYLNLGLAVRTLREDLPLLFTKDLNYDIYRDDITFVDPLNTFSGIEKYKLIFWALRFHGKILFHEISLEVYRIWQPSENVILIRWNLKGVPRVPWEAKGEFQGTSRYKLDRNGKIYEHKVDNLAFNFPQRLRPAVSVLDLVGACPASPNPTFLFGPVDVYTSSWLQFYRAVRETLDQESCFVSQDGMLEEEISMYFLFCCFGGGGEAMAYIGERVMINVFLMSPSCPPKMGEVMAYIGERVMINVFLMSPSFPPKTGEVMAYIGERAMINVFLISPSCPPQTGEAMAYIGELIQDGYVHVYKKLD